MMGLNHGKIKNSKKKGDETKTNKNNSGLRNELINGRTGKLTQRIRRNAFLKKKKRQRVFVLFSFFLSLKNYDLKKNNKNNNSFCKTLAHSSIGIN